MAERESRGLTSTIPVPAHVFAILIGKGGAYFRQLRAREGITSLWLDQAEGKLTLRGSAVAVNKLIAHVRHVIDTADRRPVAEEDGPDNPCEDEPQSAADPAAGAHVFASRAAAPRAHATDSTRAPASATERTARKPATPAPAVPHSRAAAAAAGGGSASASGAHSSRPAKGPGHADRAERTAQQLFIPAGAVSAVIGRGGNTFKMLRGRDGISSMWLDPETRELTVRGTPAAVAGVLREAKAIVAWAGGSSDLFAAPSGERLPADSHIEDAVALPDAAAVDVVAGADGRGVVINRLRRTPGVASVTLESGDGGGCGAVLRVVGEPDAVADVIYDVQYELAELRRWQQKQKQAAARGRRAGAGAASRSAAGAAGAAGAGVETHADADADDDATLAAGMRGLAVANSGAAATHLGSE